jgi:hypothetical protein
MGMVVMLVVVSLVVLCMLMICCLYLLNSILGLQKMLDICCQYIRLSRITFCLILAKLLVLQLVIREVVIFHQCVWINTLYHGLITLNIWYVLCLMHVVL